MVVSQNRFSIQVFAGVAVASILASTASKGVCVFECFVCWGCCSTRRLVLLLFLVKQDTKELKVPTSTPALLTICRTAARGSNVKRALENRTSGHRGLGVDLRECETVLI